MATRHFGSKYRRRNAAAKLLSSALIVGLLPGCSGVFNFDRLTGGSMHSYAEDVYRKQNAVANALVQAIMIAEMESPETLDELYRSEDELMTACAELQKAGYQELFGDGASTALRIEAANNLDECERESDAKEALIREDYPNLAHLLLTDNAEKMEARSQ